MILNVTDFLVHSLVQAYRNHRRVLEEFKIEKLRCEKAVGHLGDEVTGLKTKIKEEQKTQFLYEVCVEHSAS